MKPPRPLFRSPRVSSRSPDRYVKVRRVKRALHTDPGTGKSEWRDVADRPSRGECLAEAVARFRESLP